jgi:hypothetical protein
MRTTKNTTALLRSQSSLPPKVARTILSSHLDTQGHEECICEESIVRATFDGGELTYQRATFKARCFACFGCASGIKTRKGQTLKMSLRINLYRRYDAKIFAMKAREKAGDAPP